MKSKIDLEKIVTVIDWLTGYMGYDFKDPTKIDEVVKSANINYLQKKWESVRENVTMLFGNQGRQAIVLKKFNKISETILFSFSAIFILSLFVKIPVLMLLVFNPLALVVFMTLVVMRAIFKYKTRKKLKEIREIHVKKLQKISRVIQDLIFYLCDQIRLIQGNPKKYKIKINDPDYHGITIVGKPGFFGLDYYAAVPSILGAIGSKAKHYTKIIDPWAHERETSQALFKANSKAKIKLLVPNTIGKKEGYQKTWKKIKMYARNISVSSMDIRNLKNRAIFTKERAWLAADKGWHTLVEVNDNKKAALEKSFDEKWKHAQPIV